MLKLIFHSDLGYALWAGLTQRQSPLFKGRDGTQHIKKTFYPPKMTQIYINDDILVRTEREVIGRANGMYAVRLCTEVCK